MEVISSDWLYIAANGTSGAVGKSKCSLARSQGNIRAGEGGEITRVLTLAQAHTHACTLAHSFPQPALISWLLHLYCHSVKLKDLEARSATKTFLSE